MVPILCRSPPTPAVMIHRLQSHRPGYRGLPQGIQLDNGRLLVCANHNIPSGGTNSFTIHSDDHGVTWHNGANVGPPHMGECSLSQGMTGVFLYARVWWDDYFNSSAPTWTNSTRGLAFSQDGGITFSAGNLTAFPGNPMCAACAARKPTRVGLLRPVLHACQSLIARWQARRPRGDDHCWPKA
jgi:hypothetical protein